MVLLIFTKLNYWRIRFTWTCFRNR